MRYTEPTIRPPAMVGTKGPALEQYAPRLAVVSIRTARRLPSASKLPVTSVKLSRPWLSLKNISERSPVNLIGRPRAMAAWAATQTSECTSPRTPKPPPVSGEITRILSAANENTLARTARWPSAPWLGLYKLKPSSMGSTKVARGSSGLGTTRLFTSVTLMRWAPLASA